MDYRLGEHDYCQIFWAFSDPLRLRMLQELASSEKNVGDLAAVIGQPIARASHHLAILRQMGLVEDRRWGKQVLYSLPKLATQLDGRRFAPGWGGQAFEVLSVLASILTTVQARHTPSSPDAPTVRVAAASDLTHALGEILPLAERECGLRVEVSYGATGFLESQILAGAPVDVFCAARPEAIERLAVKGLLDAATALVFARGRLVVWHRSNAPFHLEALADLTRSEVRWVAIPNPALAPHGVAAQEALGHEDIWGRVQQRLVLCDNSHQALQFADSQAAAAAVVPLSLSPGPKGHYAIVPSDLHQPLDQTVAIAAKTPCREGAEALEHFLAGPIARPILKKYGFLLPEEFAPLQQQRRRQQ